MVSEARTLPGHTGLSNSATPKKVAGKEKRREEGKEERKRQPRQWN